MRHDERANATVELALVLPLLLLMLVGILEAGRALNAIVTVRNASAEGAHWAALHPGAAPSEIADIIRARVVPLDAARVTVTARIDDGSGWRAWPDTGIPAASPTPRAVPLLVEVAYPWNAVTFIGSFFPGGSGATFASRASAEALR